MQCNVGQTDKRIRMVIGVVVIAAGVYYQSWWGAVGLIPLMTAVTGYCLPYKLFNINTNKEE